MSSKIPPIVLTIAGSDSSGGAGIQADLKTFSALGVFGASVITALTAQNTQGVTSIHQPPAAFLKDQLEAVLSDLDVCAIKIGMIGDEGSVLAIVDVLKSRRPLPVVLDPVMVSTTGARLLEQGAVSALRTELLPLTTLITPNLYEAADLLSEAKAQSVEVCEAQARRLADLSEAAVLLTGGDADGDEALDILYDGKAVRHFAGRKINTSNTHGTGCTLSSAIAAYLAMGEDLPTAVSKAKAYVTAALERSHELSIGKGAGPVHHFHAIWR